MKRWLFAAIIIFLALGLSIGLYQSHKSDNSLTKSQSSDPYAGWKTYCDPSNAKGCFRYPANWHAAQFTGYENSSQTAYINYQGYNNKDQNSGTAYIDQIDNLAKAEPNLRIVGTIYNNLPSFSIFNASKIAGLKPGDSTELITTNQNFVTDTGVYMSFDATPGAIGLKTITSFDQAKAWFNSTEAKECLKILSSFTYQH